MSNTTSLIRDTIVLDQSLATRLQQKANQDNAETIILAARQILLNEAIAFDNIDLFLIADNFFGNNYPIMLLAKKRLDSDIGQPGYLGKQLTVLAKMTAGLSVVLNGGDGIKGAEGQTGADALPLPRTYEPAINGIISGETGGKGLKGGFAGNGGVLSILSVNNSIIDYTNIKLNPGNPGKGGDGGKGGINQKCKKVFTRLPPGQPMPDDPPGYQECVQETFTDNTGQTVAARGRTGEIGDDGDKGSEGQCIVNKIDETTWYTEVTKVSPKWTEYKTVISEYFFRAVNNSELKKNLGLETSTDLISLALDELDAAQRLDSTNKNALLLSSRIKVLHTPLGFSRSIDLVPDFEGYEKTYLGYYGIIADIRRIAENYFNIADIRTNIQTVLNAEAASVLAYQQAVIINLESKIKPLIKQKQDDIDKRIKIDQELSEKIEARKKFLANQTGGIGFAEIFAYVEVVVAVVGAIYTAGATLVAAAQGLMTIAKSGSDMIDAIEEIKSIKEAKTAIGEFIDVANGDKKPEDTTHEKLISSADDFISAIDKFDKDANKFKNNVEIILDINKAISQIKGAKTNDAELDTLLGQKADNMHEVLIAKKDLELLGYDEVVANRQIEAYELVANQIKNQASVINAGANNFLIQFAHMVKRSQFYMDFIIEQVFYAIRSLEILEFTNLSNLIRYDYGYFHPDLEADLNELNDQEAASKVLIAYNNSIADFATVTTYRANYNRFIKNSVWSTYTYKLNFGKDQIQDFILSPHSAILRFTIDPLVELTNASGTLTDKNYVILRSVKISFVGVTTQDLSNTFNANLYQSGALYQRTNDNEPASIVLRGRKATINDVQTRLLTNADFPSADAGFGYNSDFNLSYRSIFSYYEINVPASEFTLPNLDFSKLERIQVWFKVFYKSN